MTFIGQYLMETQEILAKLDTDAIDRLVAKLAEVKAAEGRLFILGVGGSAANASHAVSDFRKIAGIEAYTPTDNVAELTARTNDDGWHTTFSVWLTVNHLRATDMVLVLSVSGGNLDRKISTNLVMAVDHARVAGATVAGIVGDPNGHTAEYADVVVIVPFSAANRAAHVEECQSIVLHLLANHLKLNEPAMRRAVFLDRDGVLVEMEEPRAGHSPRSLSEFKIYPGAAEALQRLKRQGFMLIVVTNQPDVARGNVKLEWLDAVHEALRHELPIDGVLVCPHDDKDDCECRKPKPGLLLAAAKKHKIYLADSYMIGDSWKDILAGAEAGCGCVIIDHASLGFVPCGIPPGCQQVISLQGAVDWICNDVGTKTEQLDRATVR